MQQSYQLPLKLGFKEERSFSDFHSGANAETVEHLRNFLVNVDETFIFLWGEKGQGKTHLQQACCQEANRLQLSISYLPLKSMLAFGIEALEEIEHRQFICIDDIDAAAGKPEWEHALFVLFNRIQDNRHKLIVTASTPPSELAINLPDLKTRLNWGLTLMLKPLSDEDKLQALILQARNIGLTLQPAVGSFLLNHYRRDLPSLRELLLGLDDATLVAKRRLTLRFVKAYLEKK